MERRRHNMAEEKAREFKGPGGRGPRGPKPKLNNPGALFKRMMKYILQYYTPHCITAVICIVVSVLANVQGTLFMQTLIDQYIMPLIGNQNPDFSGLAHACLLYTSDAADD